MKRAQDKAEKQAKRLAILKERVNRIRRMPWYLEVDHAIGSWQSALDQQAARMEGHRVG